MNCEVCQNSFKDILKHVQKSVNCQRHDYMDRLIEARKNERLSKKKEYNKAHYKAKKSRIRAKQATYYDQNKSQISLKKSAYYKENRVAIGTRHAAYYDENMVQVRARQAEYYEENSSKITEKQTVYYDTKRKSIRQSQAVYHKKNKTIFAQKKRFMKHFKEKDAKKYLSASQEHLHQHCLGVCQPSSIKAFNHLVESYNGLCKFCHELNGIKLIGVNRQVCLDCKKAECTVCNTEVSTDPEFGCFHYSPDRGSLLGFLPEYCPLYSQNNRTQEIMHKCKICNTVKETYPEYELFGDTKSDLRVLNYSGRCEKVEVYVYTCNLCGSTFDYVCEFDLHMRSHTKYGKNIAIIGIGSGYPFERLVCKRVSDCDFTTIEHELFKLEGISAVLTVFSSKRYEQFCASANLEDLSLVCSVLLKEGADLELEKNLSSVKFDSNIIRNARLLDLRNHFVMDTSTRNQHYEFGSKRMIFEELLRWEDPPILDGCGIGPDTKWYKRSTALLTSRCTLQFPDDQYHGIPLKPVSNFASHVRQFLWKQVKSESLCCCESKFYCTSSNTLQKCQTGCCGKCSIESGDTMEEK